MNKQLISDYIKSFNQLIHEPPTSPKAETFQKTADELWGQMTTEERAEAHTKVSPLLGALLKKEIK